MALWSKLQVGDTIRPKVDLTDKIIRGWKYGSQCGSVGGGILKGASFRVTHIHNSPTEQYLKASVDNTDGMRHVKIAPEDYFYYF